MNSTQKLLKIFLNIFDDNPNKYLVSLEEFQKNNDLKMEYLKLKEYFKIYIKTKENDTWWKYIKKWTEPIIKMNDPTEAFKNLRDIYNKYMEVAHLQIKNAAKYFNFNMHSNALDKPNEIHMDVWDLIDRDIYDIKISILEKKNDVNSKESDYEKAVKLYWEKNYSEAFKLSRDIFQNNLENKFNSSIKHFEKKEDELSQNIDAMLKNISKIRNTFTKIGNFDSLNKQEQRSLTKLSIELLVHIEDFIRINSY